MRKTGYAVWSHPERPQVELDTVSCCHCGRIVFVKPNTASSVFLIQQVDGTWKEEPGAGCLMCMKPVCLACERDGRCTPLERKFEQLEKRRTNS